MKHGESAATRKLREQAEHALASAQSRRVIEPILERLLRVAAPGSDSAVFAHRCLAEYRVKDHPWRALLHLRQVLTVSPDDDVAHAMSGLAHIVSANYRSAVASYRAAIARAPQNPWYHHNLGHLLDVALDLPARAVPHLRLAYATLGDDEPEIASSLAHCLSRLGERGRAEALELVVGALREHPKHAGLLELAAELGAPLPGKGAPPRKGGRRAASVAAANGSATKTAGAASDEDAVLASLRQQLGSTSSRYQAAERVWASFVAARPLPPRVRAPSVGVLAAAVDYAVARRESPQLTVDTVARVYGVSARSVALRYEEIRKALEGRGL